MNNVNTTRHFLDLNQFSTEELRKILDMGLKIKKQLASFQPLSGKALAMIFEKPSTRTRVSFQIGMQQLGGHVVLLSGTDSQLGRGETIADTARVLSRYVDAIVIRTDNHEKIIEMAEYASVPVINALTDDSHPCQVMADIMTYEEHRGEIFGRKVAWCGDGNNVALSWIHAASRFKFNMCLASPIGHRVPSTVLMEARECGAHITETENPIEAVDQADIVVTDTWISMGDKASDLSNIFLPYQVTRDLMAKAKSDAIFMHCLPAHRNEEVVASVIDGPQSVVWDEAENRLHVQKGILTWSILGEFAV